MKGLGPRAAYTEHATTIGTVTICWNGVQESLFRLFLILSNLPFRTAEAIFFSVRSDSSQRDIVLSVARTELQDYPDLWQATKSLLKCIGELAGERNAAIHTMWQMDFLTDTVKVSPLTRKPPVLKDDFKSQFYSLAARLTDIDEALLNLLVELQQRLAWQGIPPPRSNPPTNDHLAGGSVGAS